LGPNRLHNSPVLVESATAFFGQMLSPDIDQSAWSMRGFNVTNGSDNDDWRCLQDGDGFNNFLLVDLWKDKAKIPVRTIYSQMN
jgi:hypothetical protein